MNIYISGASGYLGKHLVEYFSDEHTVFAIKRSSSRVEGTCNFNVKYINCDLEDEVESYFKKYNPDIIINTVAVYGRGSESLSDIICSNVIFPAELYELASKYKCAGFIHTGTSLPDNVSQYSLSKNFIYKAICMDVNSKLKFINMSVEHFYGPNDGGNKFLPYIIDACLSNKRLELTAGTQQRDFIFIDDLVKAYACVVNNIDALEHKESIPVGSGVAVEVRDIVKKVHSQISSKSKLEFGKKDMRDNELMYSCADISRLNKLGWSPLFDLDSGIASTLEGIKK